MDGLNGFTAKKMSQGRSAAREGKVWRIEQSGGWKSPMLLQSDPLSPAGFLNKSTLQQLIISESVSMLRNTADGMPDRVFGQKCHKRRGNWTGGQDLQEGHEEVGQNRSAAEKDCQRQPAG